MGRRRALSQRSARVRPHHATPPLPSSTQACTRAWDTCHWPSIPANSQELPRLPPSTQDRPWPRTRTLDPGAGLTWELVKSRFSGRTQEMEPAL